MKANSCTSRILVWDLPLRLFHWLLAASFAGAFLTAESERWRDIHVMLGLRRSRSWRSASRRARGNATCALCELRVRSIPRGRVPAYAGDPRPVHCTGHNPAGSWAIYALLASTLAVGGTGLAVYNEVGGRWLEQLHEFIANAMLAVVAIHVIGVLGGSLLHRRPGAFDAHRLQGRSPPRTRSARHGGYVAILLLGVVVGLWTGVVPTPGLPTVVAMTPVKAKVEARAHTERHH